MQSDNRVLAYHRWLDGGGDDVVVAVSFNDSTQFDYNIGMPWGGGWREIFNSDYYDHFPNPLVAGNGSGVQANGSPMHGFGQSAAVTLPPTGSSFSLARSVLTRFSRGFSSRICRNSRTSGTPRLP